MPSWFVSVLTGYWLLENSAFRLAWHLRRRKHPVAWSAVLLLLWVLFWPFARCPLTWGVKPWNSVELLTVRAPHTRATEEHSATHSLSAGRGACAVRSSPWLALSRDSVAPRTCGVTFDAAACGACGAFPAVRAHVRQRSSACTRRACACVTRCTAAALCSERSSALSDVALLRRRALARGSVGTTYAHRSYAPLSHGRPAARGI
jgi:hypothetical protein